VLTVRNRRGFTLIEMLVTAFMMVSVAGAVHQLLIRTQWLARAQKNRMDVQATVRAGSLVVLNELRELATVAGGSADQNDILNIGPGTITYRAPRGIGFLCQPSSGNQLRIGRTGFTGYRDPQAIRDGGFVFVEGSSDTDADDSWLSVAITGVSTSNGCLGPENPGITLTVSGTPSLPSLAAGTPVRVYEVMELKLYKVDASSWLGARSVNTGEAVQPLVGPLSDRDGFQLEYLNSLGSPTTDVASIQSIGISIQGTATEHDEHGSVPEEELLTRITLRNAFRQ
jgi:prepilin-type N-terminal cleavage/methylation domain-containing protein